MTTNTRSPAASRTHAIVVGIEEYAEKDWRIAPGPVLSASRFAEWLHAKGVPKSNIKIFLSPLPETGQANAVYAIAQPALPTESNLHHAIADDVSQQDGDLFIFYWAGHGLITSTRSRRLICSDATARSWSNLDITSLLRLFGSRLFRIRRQICFIDACANYLLPADGYPLSLGTREFSCGDPERENEQFLLFAAREGQRARVDTNSKQGAFSQALSDILSAQAWPPDMKAVAEALFARFGHMSPSERPTYSYCRSWNSDEDVLNEGESFGNPYRIPTTIPFSQARVFYNRDQQLPEIHRTLTDNPVVVISEEEPNRRGAGKTELAIQYCRRHLEDYPGGCVWLYPHADLFSQLNDFRGQNNLEIFSPPEVLSASARVEFSWNNWRNGATLLNGPTLLVFYGFDEPQQHEHLKKVLPRDNQPFKSIVLSRSRFHGFPSIILGGLPEQDGWQLLRSLMKGKLPRGLSWRDLRGFGRSVSWRPYDIVQYARNAGYMQ